MSPLVGFLEISQLALHPQKVVPFANNHLDFIDSLLLQRLALEDFGGEGAPLVPVEAFPRETQGQRGKTLSLPWRPVRQESSHWHCILKSEAFCLGIKAKCTAASFVRLPSADAGRTNETASPFRSSIHLTNAGGGAERSFFPFSTDRDRSGSGRLSFSLSPPLSVEEGREKGPQ